jgi:hypothetical protein
MPPITALTVELLPTPIVPSRLNCAGPVIVYRTVSSRMPGASWTSRVIWPWSSGWAESTGSVAQPPAHGPISPPSRIALRIVFFVIGSRPLCETMECAGGARSRVAHAAAL